MSLVGARYLPTSNRSASDVTFCVLCVSSSSGCSGLDATAFPMCTCEPCVPVTYQPPQRRSNGVRWSIVSMNALVYAGAPSAFGITDAPTIHAAPLKSRPVRLFHIERVEGEPMRRLERHHFVHRAARYHADRDVVVEEDRPRTDRKSTRLNSSHVS